MILKPDKNIEITEFIQNGSEYLLNKKDIPFLDEFENIIIEIGKLADKERFKNCPNLTKPQKA